MGSGMGPGMGSGMGTGMSASQVRSKQQQKAAFSSDFNMMLYGEMLTIGRSIGLQAADEFRPTGHDVAAGHLGVFWV